MHFTFRISIKLHDRSLSVEAMKSAVKSSKFGTPKPCKASFVLLPVACLGSGTVIKLLGMQNSRYSTVAPYLTSQGLLITFQSSVVLSISMRNKDVSLEQVVLTKSSVSYALQSPLEWLVLAHT